MQDALDMPASEWARDSVDNTIIIDNTPADIASDGHQAPERGALSQLVSILGSDLHGATPSVALPTAPSTSATGTRKSKLGSSRRKVITLEVTSPAGSPAPTGSKKSGKSTTKKLTKKEQQAIMVAKRKATLASNKARDTKQEGREPNIDLSNN